MFYFNLPNNNSKMIFTSVSSTIPGANVCIKLSKLVVLTLNNSTSSIISTSKASKHIKLIFVPKPSVI